MYLLSAVHKPVCDQNNQDPAPIARKIDFRIKFSGRSKRRVRVPTAAGPGLGIASLGLAATERC